MPVLKNTRHERFAQELASGKSANEAYSVAGYSKNDGNCIRLKGNERIAARVTELAQAIAATKVLSAQQVLEGLTEIAAAPLGDEHVKTNDKRLALVDLGKYHELFTEKIQVTDGGIGDRLTAALKRTNNRKPHGQVRSDRDPPRARRKGRAARKGRRAGA